MFSPASSQTTDTTDSVISALENALNVKYSDEQLDILRHNGGMCILACAGSGKTSVMTSLIAKRILTHEISSVEKLLCTTYSKGGAQEMETRLNKLLNKLGVNKTVQVKTMHALYLGVLKEFGYPSSVISNSDRRRYILEACKDVEYHPDEESFQTLDSLLSFQINNLMSDTDLVHSYTFNLEDVDLDKYSSIRKGYNTRKIQNKVIDFDDMQLYMYSLLYNQNRQDIADYCKFKWSDIYIDEAQDMSKIQYAILKKIISDPTKFVLVGDDDQCIYQWRGADPSIILNICADYDIQRFVLSTNYRCAGNIVEKAAVGIVHNSKRSNKSMRPYNPGGEIKICDCGSGNLYQMSKYAYRHIKSLVESRVSPSSIAVLSRNNAHLSILSNMLFKDGIHCEATAEMKMTKHPVYKNIRDVIDLSENGYNHNLTANTLYKVCMYLKKVDAKRISDLQRDSGLCLSDIIGYIVTKILGRNDIAWNKQVKIPSLAVTKISQSMRYLRIETIESLVMIYNVLTNNTGDNIAENRAIDLLAFNVVATEYMYRNNPDRKRTAEGLVEYISELIKTMGLNVVKQFLKMTEQYEEGKMAVPGPKICMSTMHGAKGREWDHVVLFADDNISFPSFNGIRNQMMNGVSTSDVCYGIDENRRLHYVAMTRAKKDLAIFTDRKNVSVYLLEALGIFDYSVNKGGVIVSSNDTHIISMANEGKLYNDLIPMIDEKIFGDSEYNYKIDIDDISGSIEIDYTYRGQDKKTISIDSIVTSSY